MSCVEVLSTVVNEDKIAAAVCPTQCSVFICQIKSWKQKGAKFPTQRQGVVLAMKQSGKNIRCLPESQKLIFIAPKRSMKAQLLETTPATI